ncbi:Adenylate kinase [Paenibacillus catalpae]|uniref:Adenylate kinase n=1 Tax=Paenibacillus catalpae TaxID=1045775 RepID=A0A1I2FEF3_9BACL|nr:hypothetical protein [Paenibacillus catalpae]SFF03269.1 Adenylate kinase [Paenibacillus catalpae]
MNKIFIVGIVASGKTTFAKQLSKELHIPWHELDAIVHHQTSEGRMKRTAEEQIQVIKEIDRKGCWIFEGTDRDSYQCLYHMADTIIFVDPPLGIRKWRILSRFMKQNLGMEPCHYKPDLIMLQMMFKWTQDFERNRPSFEAKLRMYEDKVIRIRDVKKKDQTASRHLR